MKVIFLDIDGVLNVMDNGSDEFGQLFHAPFVENLKHIISQTGAKIVISSTWRMSGLSVMQTMWEMRDLPGEVIGVTCNAAQLLSERMPFYDMVERGHEIQEWLDNNSVSHYVILDDDNDMLASQKENFVRCANNKHHEGNWFGLGLTKECAEKAIEILNKQTNANKN